jgi:hypothetical protein
MKLRYLRVGNYPPIKDTDVAFAGDSPLARACSIRFAVGVNGSGKSHLLQAISEVFLALADWRVPHFPVTLVYELGAEYRQTVIVAASRTETQPEPSIWMSEGHFFEPDAMPEDFQALIDQLYREPSQVPYRPIIAPGSWSGMATPQLSYMPQTVLAYTTGAQAPWQALWQRGRNAAGIDSLFESLESVFETERPPGWMREDIMQEKKDAMLNAVKTSSNLEMLKRQIDAIEREIEDIEADGKSSGWQPILITPELLKFALLAVVLPAGLNRATESIRFAPEDKGLAELLGRAGWDYPVSVCFEVDFKPREWPESKLRRLLPWLEAAGEITGEPNPGTRRSLHFDLLGRLNEISDPETRQHFAGLSYQGEALLSLLNNHGSASAFQRFQLLHDLHRGGLFANLNLCLRKTDAEDLIFFDELSDGEQMVLGRMALFYLLKGQHDALLLLDEPETHFNDKWKREIVDIIDNAMGETASEILISTHAAIVLTDAMSHEITLLERGKDHGAVIRPIESGVQTFGATSDHPLRDVFGSPDTVGKRASIILETLLAAPSFRTDVESYWAEDLTESVALADNLLSAIKASQPARTDWSFDTQDVVLALKQIKKFAVFYKVETPINLEKVILAFIKNTGPGYFRVKLMLALNDLTES